MAVAKEQSTTLCAVGSFGVDMKAGSATTSGQRRWLVAGLPWPTMKADIILS